jgi:hypothetical protein
MLSKEPSLDLYVRKIKDGEVSSDSTNDKLISMIIKPSFMTSFVGKPAHSSPSAVTFTAQYPSTVISIQLEGGAAFALGYNDICGRQVRNDQ